MNSFGDFAVSMFKNGYENDNVYQKQIEVICCVDIPINFLIEKLKTCCEDDIFYDLLNTRNPIMVELYKSNGSKKQNYLRFLLGPLNAMYINMRLHNDISVSIDADAIEFIKSNISIYTLGHEMVINAGTNINDISSEVIRPVIVSAEYPDVNVKFIDTTMHIRTE